jgi:hypothetical protein
MIVSLVGCSTADVARTFGRRDQICIQIVASDSEHPLGQVPVKVSGLSPRFPMTIMVDLAQARTDDSGRCEVFVPAHYEYDIEVGSIWGRYTGLVGHRIVKRSEVAKSSEIQVEVKWEDGTKRLEWEL